MMRKLMAILFIMTVMLSACSSRLPSINKVVSKGAGWTEGTVSQYTKEEITAEWGNPVLDKTAESRGLYRWEGTKGSVTLSFPNGYAHIEEVTGPGPYDFPWPLSLIPYGSRWRVVLAFFFAAIPLVLIFTVISLVLKKTGITGGDETVNKNRSGKGWFFSRPDGARPWDGI